MAVDFGTDIQALPDLGARFVLQSGQANLGEAIARRLQTPRGGLFYDDSYGFDLRAYLSETLTDAVLAQLGAEVEAEVVKDERVSAASATVTAPDLQSLSVSLVLTTASGPFRLVLGVSALTVAILRAG